MLVFAYVIAVREEDEGSRERHVNDRAGTKGREHVVVPQAVPHAFDKPVWDRLDARFMQVLRPCTILHGRLACCPRSPSE